MKLLLTFKTINNSHFTYAQLFSLQLKFTCHQSKRIVQILTTFQASRPAATRRRPPDFILHAALSFCLFWAFCRSSLHSSLDSQVRLDLRAEILELSFDQNFLIRMLETLSWCNHCNCNPHAHIVPTRERCHGLVAHSRILWEGKSRRRGIFPTMAKCKLMTLVEFMFTRELCAVKSKFHFSLFFLRFPLSDCRSWKKILASHMIGAILLHGPLLHANWSQPFCSRDQPCAYEVNAKRRNSSTFNISCQSTHRRQPILTHRIHSKCIPLERSTVVSTVQHQGITTIKG